MNKYKIISCASFGSSGSGVVTDYLQEFNNIYNPGDFEFRFLQDYGGVTTLEDCLVHSHHRHNSDTAIKIFIKYITYQCGDIFNKRYNQFFDNKFGEISWQYLNELIDTQWDGYWEEYMVMEPKYQSILKYKIWPRLMAFLNGNRKYRSHYLPHKTMYFSNPSYEYFIECTKRYLTRLFQTIDPEHKYEYLFLDQLLPSDNINRYFNYFDDLHVVVVDRDPRDYYIENVMRWGEGWVPKEIDKFVTFYAGVRKKLKDHEDNANVLRLKFEDTIYKYDKTMKELDSFLNLSEENHINKLKFFNPNRSINNTQLWKKYKISKDIMHKIEDELSEYCYEYE